MIVGTVSIIGIVFSSIEVNAMDGATTSSLHQRLLLVCCYARDKLLQPKHCSDDPMDAMQYRSMKSRTTILTGWKNYRHS